MRNLFTQLAISWGMLVIFLLVYTDWAFPRLIQISDYLMTFHTAGYLVAHGEIEKLYPALEATSFVGAPFDMAAHQILEHLPASSTAEYLYMPLIGYIFVPFSCLTPSLSLFFWQIISLVSLAGSSFLVTKTRTSKDERHKMPLVWFCLTFLPIMITLWIGQTGIVFGILPLCAGYNLMLRGRPFASGLIWSLTILKPQFLLVPVMVSFAEIIQRRWKEAVGLFGGACCILLLNLWICSPQLVITWLHCLRLSDTIYSDIKSGVAVHIATSLPRALLLLLPLGQQMLWKPMIYFIVILLMSLAGLRTYKIARSSLNESVKISLCVLIALYVTPLIVPHLFFYDLSLLAITGMIMFSVSWHNAISRKLRSVIGLTWLGINIYAMILLVNKSYACPALLVLFLAALYLSIIGITGKANLDNPS